MASYRMLYDVSCRSSMRLSEHPLAAVRGALLGEPAMKSEERRAARRARREQARLKKREERLEGLDLDAVADLGNLYKAAHQAARGVMWKSSTQRYMKDVLRNTVKSRRDLLDGVDICKGFNRFTLYERGKLRHIAAVKFSERVVHKSLSQNVLVPAITPSLISSNSANVKGRGTHYAIMTLKKQLARHWQRHGSEGYILLIDFSDYFGRIDRDCVKAQIDKYLDNEDVIALSKHLIDVQGEVGLGLGSEPNQILAIAYPNEIDHLVTEMCGVEAYGRYMDDSYVISPDKSVLQATLAVIADRCAALGIVINWKKTRIVKLSRGFTFLKKRFFFTDTGRIVVKPCRASITRERRKLKKQASLYREGNMTFEQVWQSYQSWRGGMTHFDAHRTVLSMDALFKELMGDVISDE